MFRASWLPLLLLAAAAPALAADATPASPEPAPTAQPAPADLDEGEVELELIPAAKDNLGGHLVLAAAGFIPVPFGELDSQLDYADQAGTGVGVGGDVGIGVSRSVVVGGWVQYLSFNDDDDCVPCTTTSFAFGAFARYHLVQGVRFDPWASIGAGFSMLDATRNGPNPSYSGPEWLRLQVGGDWYPLSQIGFGPYMELDLGSFTDRPVGRGGGVHGTFLVGMRLAIDAKGR